MGLLGAEGSFLARFQGTKTGVKEINVRDETRKVFHIFFFRTYPARVLCMTPFPPCIAACPWRRRHPSASVPLVGDSAWKEEYMAH